jgi:signal transduction histidine kinase
MAPAGSVTRTASGGRASVGKRTRVALWWLPRNVDGRRGAYAAGLGVLLGVAGVVAVDRAGWLGVLLIGVGLAVGWAVGRHDTPGRRAWAELEAELQSQTRELRESRARLAQGADAERRRIERDLHDGCQQRLIALRIKLGLAEELVDVGNVRALRLIEEVAGDAESALEDLHTVVHGVYPSLLMDRGLADALKGLARSAPMRVGVFVEGRSRYPAEVEAAVYFACAEALQNATKHAGGVATARIALRHDSSGLVFEVRDDGRGFGDEVRAGAGFANMEDRVSAVGGRLRVTSAPGCGTTVQGWVDQVQPIDGPSPAQPVRAA